MTDAPHDLVARRGSVTLAGSLWMPDGAPRALVHLHPGSGASDRDNDVLFPLIRSALRARGIAVSSFDKRGVGGSSGSWQEAGIREQAADLAAGVAAARGRVPGIPVGLFGHSQGGWVVLEAAEPAGADFVIANSGPGVTPREQETFSTASTLRKRGWGAEAVAEGLRTFGGVMDLLTLPFDEGWPRARALPLVDELRAAGAFIPDEESVWTFAAGIVEHDPAPALRRFAVPLLVLLGGADDVVPVERSAQVYRDAVRPDLLELHVLPGGDHRLQDADDAFVPDYLETLTGFVERRITR